MVYMRARAILEPIYGKGKSTPGNPADTALAERGAQSHNFRPWIACLSAPAKNLAIVAGLKRSQ